MSRFLVSPLAGLFVLAASAPSVLAWGPTGHRAVGRIAEKHLTPQAARAVAELLGPETLAYVTTWPDEIRSEPEWTKADDWHWVTVPDGQTYETSPKNPKGDVLEGIVRFQKALSDRSTPPVERVQALKWLGHLVGDLHMPLHVGGGDDRGGNDTVVLWFGEPTNLHSVWDSRVIEHSELSFTELAEMLDHASPEQVRTWQRSGPLDWAAESQALRRQVYALGDRRLSFKYVHDQWPTVQQRLLQAGIRLAGEINRLLGP